MPLLLVLNGGLLEGWARGATSSQASPSSSITMRSSSFPLSITTFSPCMASPSSSLSSTNTVVIGPATRPEALLLRPKQTSSSSLSATTSLASAPSSSELSTAVPIDCGCCESSTARAGSASIRFVAGDTPPSAPLVSSWPPTLPSSGESPNHSSQSGELCRR